MRAAPYARVSTYAGQNPEMQLAALREYCARRGWQIAGEYVDTGISGKREPRPELDRMLAGKRRRWMQLSSTATIASPAGCASWSMRWKSSER
jgi:Resolvase, N terminal domain